MREGGRERERGREGGGERKGGVGGWGGGGGDRQQEAEEEASNAKVVGLLGPQEQPLQHEPRHRCSYGVHMVFKWCSDGVQMVGLLGPQRTTAAARTPA